MGQPDKAEAIRPAEFDNGRDPGRPTRPARLQPRHPDHGPGTRVLSAVDTLRFNSEPWLLTLGLGEGELMRQLTPGEGI